MDELTHKQATQQAVKRKFGRKRRLVSRYNCKYPQGAEREFQRLTDGYMKILSRVVKEYLPSINAVLKENPIRQDGSADTIAAYAAIRKIFQEIGFKLEKETEDYGMYERLKKLADMSKKLSYKEWKKAVKATLGIDLLDDYYSGDFFRSIIDAWVESNVGLIKTITDQSLEKMQDIVSKGWKNGKLSRDIAKEMQEEYGISKRHARFIARDQTAKLNSQITRKQQEDAGVTEYIWSTSDDDRVRKGHKLLDGKRFKYSEPPIVDQRTGRRCNPGEDYRCRCVALPAFDFETVDLPWMKGSG